MRFHVVYRNINGKVQPVAMDKPEQAPRVKLPGKAKVIVVDKKTGKVVEDVVVSEVDGNIVVTAEQDGIREAVVIVDGQARGITLLEGAPASEMAASIPFEALAVESVSSAALYIGGGLAAAAGGGAAFAAASDKQPPVFLYGPKDQTIAENSPAGSQVYMAQATDNKGKVTYSLKQGSDAGLTIDPVSGKVTLTGTADYEAKSSYSFVVVATDAAGNASEQTVTVTVGNVDERGPSITSSATAATIQENSGAGQVVYTAAATDNDFVAPATANSVIYSLKPGSDAGLSIDPQTGRVTLAGDPDYETKSSYSFTVIATDAAGLSTEKVVTLAIGDVVEDAVPPHVASVAITADSETDYTVLNAGDKVTVTVTMDENTIVDTTSGTPRLALNIGGTTVYATYTSGSGTQQLTFRYTILDGQNDANGISIAANSIDANGAILADAAGNRAVLTHAVVADNASFQVDTVDPVATIELQPGQPASSGFAKFEATGNTTGMDIIPRSAKLNAAGDFVLTWTGMSTDKGLSVFVQKCRADGTPVGDPVQLDGNNTVYPDSGSQIAVLGSTGKFAVSWLGQLGSEPNFSIFVQIFNADGSKSGVPLQFDSPLATTNLRETLANILSLNEAGDFVVVLSGDNTTGPYSSSVWVQKVHADGTLIGTPVQLDGVPTDRNGNTDLSPQVAAVGNDGSFVVTWFGIDGASSPTDYSVFAQKFGADGQPVGGLQTLETIAPDQSSQEANPRIASLGPDGSYAITWAGYAPGDLSKSAVYVQRFAADGSAQGSLQRLDGAQGLFTDNAPNIGAVGTTGKYVVAWTGYNSTTNNDTSIYVQLFGVDGAPINSPAKLDGAPDSSLLDMAVQIVALGSNGDFAIAWTGYNNAAHSESSIYVQKFHADGSLNGTAFKFDAYDRPTTGADGFADVIGLGDNGDFLLAWAGQDADGDYSIYLNKTYNTPATDPMQVGSSNEPGKLYLVQSTQTVSTEADILALAGDLFNAQANLGANVKTALDTTGLLDGNYKLYAVDPAGNLSAASDGIVTVGGVVTPQAQTVFVLGEGYPNLVDGGDGLFNGWDGSPGGDDIVQSFTQGNPGYVDFAQNAVDVKFLGIPELRPLDMTGFGADDSVEIFLSDLPQPYYGIAPIAATSGLNKNYFSETTWNGMTMSGGPSFIYDGKVAMWSNREPYAHLGVKFISASDGAKEMRLVYDWKTSGSNNFATSRLMAIWGTGTTNTQVYSNTTVQWPYVAPPPPL